MDLPIPIEFIEELKSSGITRAVVVDDLFEPPSLNVVTDVPGFFGGFSEVSEAHPELKTIFVGVESWEDIKDSHIVECWETFQSGKSQDVLAPLFGDYPERIAELQKLSTLLTSIFGKTTEELVPTDDIPEDAKLVFLDFHLGEGDEAAVAIAKKLAALKEKRPYLVLISDSPDLVTRSDGFRMKTGYLAGTFAHLEKTKAIDPAELAYSMASWGLGNSALRVIQPLFDAMLSSVDEAADAVKSAMKAVTIQDYSFLQNLSLAGDGNPLGEYIVDLFGSAISYRFRGSENLKAARLAADTTPFKSHLPLSMVPSHTIVELYREALTEPCVEEQIAEHPWCSEKTKSVVDSIEKTLVTDHWVEVLDHANINEPLEGTAELKNIAEVLEAKNESHDIEPLPPAPETAELTPENADSRVCPQDAVPDSSIIENPAIAWLGTGDIFLKDETSPLLMVLNAGCDLQFSPTSTKRPAQPDRSILLIEGKVYPISNLTPPDEIARTEFFKLGTTLCRINWTDHVRTIKHGEFKNRMEIDGYRKRIARLSLPYVLQVQQAWLASLGRVGVPVAPPHSGSNDIEIFVKEGTEAVQKVRIPHGATVFRVKQKLGYNTQFLLSQATVSAVRHFLQEMLISLLAQEGDKARRKAEKLTAFLEDFTFWRSLQETPKSFTSGLLILKDGFLKVSFKTAVVVTELADTLIILRFSEPTAQAEPVEEPLVIEELTSPPVADDSVSKSMLVV